MGRKHAKATQALKHKLYTRVNDAKYEEFLNLLKNNPGADMSSLLRDILYKRPVKVFTYDRSLDVTMEELAKLRAELRAIGININQITKFFNAYPEAKKKEFYAKVAFQQYQAIDGKVEQILSLITKLSLKWL